MSRPCIGYCRVSTERQAGERQTSLADQERAITALASSLGLTVSRWYRDDGASGATVEKRPALRQLIADCEATPQPASAPGFVLVLNDSRWGRFPDPEDSAYWRRHLGHRGWIVRFAENDDTQNPQLRTVMRAIVATQATQKREDVRDNARRGSRGTAAQGFWATRAPYGYRRKVVFPADRVRILETHQRKATDEKVALTPHAAEATVVRELYRRYASGVESIASLTEWLRERAPDRTWTRAAVKFTLSNPAYVGDVVSGRYSPDERRHRPESEWVTKRDAHPAIIDRALYERVQAVLARNATWTTRVRTDWIVSGLVACRCGKPYVAGGSNMNQRHEATRSYRCVTKAGLKADRCPYPGTVKKEWLERAVVDTVSAIVAGPSQRKRLAAHLDRALRALTTAPAEQVASLATQIAEATTTRDRLVAAVADGTLTGEEAKGRLGEARRQMARLEAQRDAFTSSSLASVETERAAIEAVVLDFKRMASVLAGPALRELIRPWIHSATFDPATRQLSLAIRHVPVSHGALASMAWPSDQNDSATFHNVTRRTVRVGGAR